MYPSGGAELTVPPGFRFHPTDEELLYYYLRKKVAYEAIDLDVIREIDLNKLEPWDLKDRCRIGSGPQDEWYFFSHKDKKYPTGTRTNRATTAGFWKATGRDKAILLSDGRRIGLRKTLVFYTGRAPHGKKSDWIMHEYRLDDDTVDVPEEGWVVCRVFKKKSIHQRGFEQHDMAAAAADDVELRTSQLHGALTGMTQVDQKHILHQQFAHGGGFPSTFDASMHLPQLTSADTPSSGCHAFTSTMNNTLNGAVDCSQNMMMKLTASSGGGASEMMRNGGGDRFGASADWSILDKLLASHQSLDQLFHGKVAGMHPQQQQQLMVEMGSSALQRLPFHYLGCEAADLLKFSM